MKKNVLKTKKYIASLLLILVVISTVAILKIGSIDKIAGKVKIKEAHLSNVSTKLNSNIYDALGDNAVTSNGYDQINYELTYKVSEEGRDVIITGALNDDERFASFKRAVGDNITSTLSNNGRKIEIVISNAPKDEEISTNVVLQITGAPNGYTVNPRFQIKESTSDSFDDIYTNPIEVSTNSLRGTVRNQDNDGIGNIIVSLYKNEKLVKETYTNSNGEYIFSDLNNDSYTIKINEEIYKNTTIDNVRVSGDSSIDLITERIYPFNLQVHKYITKVDAYNVGNLISRSYSNAFTVNFPIEKLQSLSGKVYYKIVVENTGEKEGIVSAVKDELPEFMSFNEEENSGFELVNGYIYDRNLEGITLAPGESREDSLVLNIIDTKEAKTYLNRVNAEGEIYNHVVYLLDNQTYKEEDVLEGELTTRPDDPTPNFEGWYTDSKYTNLYNFNNPVIKNLVLYGKTAQKYRVEFYDKDPETGTEEPYDEQEVNGGDPVTKPNPDPTHTGYTFEHWCKTDLTEYVFGTPVNENLKLITCYKINEYDVNFYNYSDTVEKNTKVEYKHLIDQTEAPTFDETGYTFLCWSENKSDCFDFTTPVTKEINLYPTHERLNNAVVFDDENRVTTVEVPYGDTVEPIADQGKTGHSFRCWSEDRENCFDFTTPIIQNTTVYAIYDINKFTVHFIDVNPETSEQEQYGEDQIIDYGNTATRPDPNPSHTGYTFSEWKDGENTYNFETPVTSDITLVSSYNINSYPVRFHNDNEVTTVNVQYKQKVTPITSPTKEHHIFTAWLDANDLPFDFDTLIVDETDLYSSFEEVLSPKISHTPTMWTNGNVSVTVSKNDSLDDDTGYSYLYKTTEGTYETYETPVTITENTTIIAKAVKSEVGSEVTSHEIVNIDKLNPTVTNLSENAVNRTSVTLNVSVLDNESGVNYYEIYQDNIKVGEKHLECYSETTFDEYETCRENLPDERITTYTVTGLTQATTYTFKIKVFDKAGNSAVSDEIEVTTTEPVIVARLIGYNNQLFEDTIDDTTGDVIIPKEDKYINFESLEEAFNYEDLYDCKNVQCTIQMVRNTNESVEVLEGQDLTLDLNGKVVSGITEDYTIKNNGDFTLIDSTPDNEDAGKLTNSEGIAILNKTGASLTLGEGYSDREVAGSIVSTTKPYIYGRKNGVKNEANGEFKIFDGKIVSISSTTPGFGAVNGQVTGTEYSYEAKSNTTTIDEVEYQIITLNQIVDPEARINKSIYFAKLNTAMDSATTGTSIVESESGDLMRDLAPADDTYYFEYDETTGTWISNNNQQATVAKSTITINLLNAEYDKNLSIEYLINPASNGQKGTSSVTISTYDNHGKSITGNTSPSYYPEGAYRWVLKKGKVYVLNVSYTQPSINQTEDDEGVTLGNMVINNLYYSDYIVSESESSSQEDEISVFEDGFYYDEETNTLRSTIFNACDGKPAAAYSQQVIDLTNKEGDYELIVNASVETIIGSNYEAFIFADTNPSYEYYYSNPILKFYGTNSYDPVDPIVNDKIFATYGADTGRIKLTGGNKYYLKFIFRKYGSSQPCATDEEYAAANNANQMIIHSINLVKISSETETINTSELETKHNYLNEFVSNSKGTFNLSSDETKASTDNLTSNQASASYLNIDLTNDEIGGIFTVTYNETASSDGTKTNPSTLMNYIYEQDGEERTLSIYNNAITNEDGSVSLYYSLRGGGKYRFDLSYSSQTLSGLEYYSNLNIDNISYSKLSNFEGNNFNGLYNYNGLYALSTNSYCQGGKYLDSYIKLDLTNYDKDQLLSLPYFMYTTSNTRAFVYLTNNNRALSLEDAINDRNNMIMYMYENSKYPSYRNGNSYYLSSSYGNYSIFQRDIVLKKGEIYYLHFANHNNDTYTCSPGPNYNYSGNGSIDLYNISLTPIEEELIMYGNNTIFTGTEDYADKTEESSTITLNQNPFDDLDLKSGIEIYDYRYNEENDSYEPQNTGAMTAAVLRLKFDLTESSTDKNYLITNSTGTETSRLLTISENEDDITPINFNTMIGSGTPSGYDYMSKFTLQKGKVYYVQIVSYLYSTNDNNPTQNAIRISEYKFDNETTEYNTFNEIRKFNEKVDTVQLLKDVVVSDKPVTVDYEKEVILDLNGHSLTTTNQPYVIDNSGDLTVIDSNYDEEVAEYEADLEVYREYAGLCDDCEPSDEYILDHASESLYKYSGKQETFVAYYDGDYLLETWGAQGGSYNDTYLGGYGGYSKGKIHLEKGDTLYINVGGQGVKSTKSAQSFAGGYNGGGNAYGYTDKFVGSGGGATHIATASGLLSSLSENQNSVLIVAGGGGGAGYSSNSYNGKGGAGGGYIANNGTTSRNITTGKGGTQIEGGAGLDGANVANSGSFGQGANSTNNGTGGGGGWYGGGGGKWDAAGGGGSGYLSTTLTNKEMYCYNCSESAEEATKTTTTTCAELNPTEDCSKKGDGYARITLLTREQYEEDYSKLDKKYDIKEEPEFPDVTPGSIVNSVASSTIFNNQEKASLTIKVGTYTTNGTNSTVIKNAGDLVLDGPVEIKVNNTGATGIENYGNGTIELNDDNSKITLNVSSCSTTPVTSRGILLKTGNFDFTHLNISGKNGAGIEIDSGVNVAIHTSNINITDTCSTTTLDNAQDNTATSSYNKSISYSYKTYVTNKYTKNQKYDGAIYQNGGTTVIDNGSSLTGTVNVHAGKIDFINGTTFNDYFQNGGEATINMTGFSTNKAIYNEGGILNFGTEEAGSYSVNAPNILNLGTMNTYSSSLQSVYNLGTLNTNNTFIGKLYNLNTYIDKHPESRGYGTIADYKGIANINGGGVYNDVLVNESQMTIDGASISKGIINRKDLTVKGNSTVVNNNGAGIFNEPFTFSYEWTSIGGSRVDNPRYVAIPVSVTIGENDGTVSNSPSIIAANSSSSAITGNCYSKKVDKYNNKIYQNWIDEDLHFYKYSTKIYRVSNNFNIGGIADMEDYYVDNTLCDLNYYDGTLQTSRGGPSNTVTDIGITNIADGQDLVLTSETSVFNLKLLPINSSDRPDLFEVNGTNTKSLQAAIDLVPDNTPTTINLLSSNGTLYTASPVTIPENKEITLSGNNTSYIHSKDAYITNNGTLNLNFSVYTRGQTFVKNNNILNVSGGSYQGHFDSFDYFYREANLLKNYGTTIMSGFYSSNLDYRDHGTLIINSGDNLTNATIHSYGSTIELNNPYINNESNNDRYRNYIVAKNKDGQEITSWLFNAKPLFRAYKNENGIPSTITIHSISANNYYLGEFNDSTVNLNYNHNNWSWIGNTFINGNGVLNVYNGSVYNNKNTIISGTYNQYGGYFWGAYQLGKDAEANIKAGTLEAYADGVDLFTLAENNKITLGTKGTGTASKTSPSLICKEYCFGNVVASDKLNIYDGILKATSNPINITIDEIEDGFALIYNRKANPKEAYLEDLSTIPVIHNYTTKTDYFDIQLAFNEANEDDELILIRDAANGGESPSIVIANDKKFTLYLSYILDFDANNNKTYTPYKDGDSVEDINMIETPILSINNADIIDSETGEVTEVPFIINNGDVTIYGSSLNDIPSNEDDDKTANFDDNSGARIITNNGTLNLYEVSAVSEKAIGTMFKNTSTGTMNIRRSKFETNANTVFDNAGTINMIASSGDTNTCYNPTIIKIINNSISFNNVYSPLYRYESVLSDNYKRYLTNPIKETIINSGTMNVNNLYVDSDYAFNLVQNTGTMSLNNVSIEQFNNDYYGDNTTAISTYDGKPTFEAMINKGTLSINKTTSFMPGSIYNDNILNVADSQLNTIEVAINNNSGKVNIDDSEINSSGIGIVSNSNNETVINDTNITASSNIWKSFETQGTLKIDGGTYISNADNNGISYLKIKTNNMVYSCNNNTPVTNYISGNFKRTSRYYTSNSFGDHDFPGFDAFCLGENEAIIKNATIKYSNTDVIPKTPDSYTNQKYYYNEFGLITSYNSKVTIEDSNIDLNQTSSYYQNITTDQTVLTARVHGIIVNNSDLDIINSEITSIHNKSVDNTINIGEKDSDNAQKPMIQRMRCSSDNTKGINLYDGYVYIDNSYLCKFNDKETNYNIVGDNDNKRYLSQDNYIKNVDKDIPYNSLSEAINNASSGDTLQLLKDISFINSETAYTLDNEEIVLDLNGYDINADITLINGSNLTVTDSAYLADSSIERGRLASITNTSGTLTINEGYVKTVDNSSTITMTSGNISKLNTTSGTVTGGTITTLNNTGNLSVSDSTITTLNSSSAATVSLDTVTLTYINNNDSSKITLKDSKVSQVFYNYDTSELILDGGNTIYQFINTSSTSMTFNNSTISTLKNILGDVTLNGASVSTLYNTGPIKITNGTLGTVINSADATMDISGGTINYIYNRHIFKQSNGSIQTDHEYDQNLKSVQVGYNHIEFPNTTLNISGGTIGTIINKSIANITGGTITSISNGVQYYKGTLTLGNKDGIVSTTSPVIRNTSGYAITAESRYSIINFYDGILTGSSATSILSGEISTIETNYVPNVSPDYDEHGDLTGTYSMVLKPYADVDIKVACVNGVCYGTLQEAINASVNNYTEESGCPDVTIGDDIYFALELDDDLVLDPQYSLTIDLNHHNINTNGHTIPNNITLVNGSVDGGDLQSSLARFLSNVLGTNDNSKDIIITKMEDGNALDTTRTYKLYRLENGSYLPIKVDSDGAGKYSLGKETTDMKSIKGRIYINNVDAGEYMLKDNLDNELEFTIYNDGTLSPNIRENIVSEYGHMTASAIATLIISIQTGILRVSNILIALAVIILIIIIFLLYKKKSTNKKETI